VKKKGKFSSTLSDALPEEKPQRFRYLLKKVYEKIITKIAVAIKSKGEA
jgi:hypothetical protein